MRREQLMITDQNELKAVLKKAIVCHLALNNTGCAPYIVTMNFGSEFAPNEKPAENLPFPLTFWFHSASEGLKLDLLRADPRVGFQVESDVRLVKGPGITACEWGMEYESIVGSGLLTIASADHERRRGLLHIMKHYGGEDLPITDQAFAETLVLSLQAAEFTGKRSRRLWPQLA